VIALRSIAKSLAVAATLTAALTACHAAPRPRSAESLQGRAFLLRSNEGAALLDGTTVHLSVTDTDLSVTARCNHMGGSYKIDDDRLIVGSMFQTEMGCDAERHAQDDWLQAFFASQPHVALRGNELTLSNDSSSLVFLDREVADPDRPLQGTVWEINTYTEGEGAMGLMGIEAPRVTFAADGAWQARSVCLDASGRYIVEGDRIVLSGTRAVQGECADNDKEAAQFVRSVLVDGELRYAIDARRLELKSNGPRSLSANAAEP
jgi:heat shock protein HslJ